jgi:excisionase family DNA binding protein
MQDDAFITVAQAAFQLGVSEDTVKRRIRRGELRGKQVPRPQGYVWLVELSTTRYQDAGRSTDHGSNGTYARDTAQHHDAGAEENRVDELVTVLQSQVAAQQRQIDNLLAAHQDELAAKNKQIEQLHILLQQAQAALPTPRDNRSWWQRLWRRD